MFMKKQIVLMLVLSLFFTGAGFAGFLETPHLASGLQIRPDNRYFDVLPRIVPADQESTVSFVPLFDHVKFTDNAIYELTYTPMEFEPVKGGPVGGTKTVIIPENGRISITMLFEEEQEHDFILNKTVDGKTTQAGRFRIYSLKPDLYGMRPYKGDFHQHSHRSDGVESPPYVAGICRRAGLDFTALSDHHFRGGSIEARDFYNGLPIDLRLYPGEECHFPGNPVHILSFGAEQGLTELWKNDQAACDREIAEIQAALTDLPAGVNPFHYAACVWETRKIAEFNGMSMFCHPYWVTGNRYNVDERLMDHIFATGIFDAYEVISGFDWNSLNSLDVNGIQVARYVEECAKGRRMPVCGIGDTHGHERSDQFGRYYTLVFAPSSDLQDLIAGIKGFRSVAVETPKGELARAYGPFRIVKYATYLLREVLPQHDELCFEEGRLMIQYASGDTSAVDRLALLQGQVARFYDKVYSPAK